MNNLLVAQSGGPTAAINATVVGVLLNAYSSNQVDEVFGAINGIQGVLDEHFVKLRDKIKSPEDFQLLEQTPAAALGSCRLKLKDLEKDREQFQHIIEIFRKYEIKYFIYIGGNDSMDTVDKLSQYCSQNQITDITVVGAPKTIDNDLVGTDHCPGFGSAAKYIGITFAELAKDCHVYAAKAVTIVEVMGR
ncbi:MAG: 6-phosphofructokinase, partial [Lachnospiraceae bacterium]